MSDWNETRIAELTNLWQLGLTAAQIAYQFNRDQFTTTRSAVCGKLGRLGLTRETRAKPLMSSTAVLQPKPIPEPKPKPVTSVNVQRLQRKRISLAGKHHGNVVFAAQADEVRDLAPDHSPDAVSLLRVENGQCRWPLGDPQKPGFMFCGSPAEDVYCPRHARVAYQR